jgi:Arc/MetJ family transcription regulator
LGDLLLRRDLVSFAQRCFRELNSKTRFAMSWHIEIIAAKLMAVRDGEIRRLIVNLPPRHLKSLLASVAFPAWCLGRDPSAQIICVSYAQDLADKLSRDCRAILAGDWYRQLFLGTRLSPQRAAMPEFNGQRHDRCCPARPSGRARALLQVWGDMCDNMCGGLHMATNLSIDPDLLDRALAVSGERTKKAAVTKALQEFIARRQQKRLLELIGKLEWDAGFDYKAERSRR